MGGALEEELLVRGSALPDLLEGSVDHVVLRLEGELARDLDLVLVYNIDGLGSGVLKCQKGKQFQPQKD